MNTFNAAPAVSQTIYRQALDKVLAGLGPDDARSLRSYAVRFLDHCVQNGIDPIVPGAAAFDEFTAELTSPQRWRFAHAVRRVLAEVGQPAHTHGLGLGDQSHLVREALDGPAGDAIRTVVERAGRRACIWRAALGRLLAFCREEGWNAVDLDPADLDDYRDWLFRLGLFNWEIRQVAEIFVEALASARVSAKG